MAYFDNAATSYPKPDVVYSGMDAFYRNHGGSAGRGEYALAMTAKGLIEVYSYGNDCDQHDHPGSDRKRCTEYLY